jgi:sugar lactone lactonase YvrE
VVNATRSTFAALAGAALLLSCRVDDRTLSVAGASLPTAFSELEVLAGTLEDPHFVQPIAIAGCGDPGVSSGEFAPFCVVDGNRILRVSRNSGSVTLVAGSDQTIAKNGVGADAGFGSVADMTSDSAGALYVLDGCAVRKIVVATGEVSTVAANVNTSCGTADGVVLGAPAPPPSHLHYCAYTNSLFVSDGRAVREVDVTTGSVTNLLGPNGQPWVSSGASAGPVLSLGSSLFVADGSVLQRVELDAGTWTAKPGPYSAGSAITSLAIEPDYLYSLQGDALWRLEIGTGDWALCLPAGSSTLAPAETSLGCPSSVAAGLNAAAVYVTDACLHSVQVVDCDQGTETALVVGDMLVSGDGDASGATFAWPSGLTTDDAGNTYVVDSGSIRRISASGHVTTLASAVLTGPSDTSWPVGIVWDGATALYVADAAGHTIRKVITKTGAVFSLSDQGTIDLIRPTGLAIDRRGGGLYVSDITEHTIRRVDLATNQVTLVAGQPYVPGSADGDTAHATLLLPAGVAVDGTSLVFADSGSKTIRLVRLDTGEVKTIAGSNGVAGIAGGSGLHARFVEPVAVTLVGPGRIAVADRLAGTVSTFDLMNGDATNVDRILGAATPGTPLPVPATNLGPAPSHLYLPQALAVDSSTLLVSVPNAILRAR